ncbi:MAG: tetratricopeptide repeat protein [Nitrospirota bacterium]|nr:tetratricopeptide repeat protein [Nitrospirota bacterium]
MNTLPESPYDPDRRFFSRIMAELLHRHYEAAASGFRLFAELHPTSTLLVHGHYWLGECEYQLGQYQDAIDAFDLVLSRAPFDPQLAAAAFLRKANSYAQLGDARRSKNLLELVVVQFPATGEAAEARHTLLFP